MKKTIVVILMLAFVACSTKIYTPTSANVNKKETATLAELQQGHDLFKDKCGKCHKLPKPENRNAEQWTKVLEKMGPMAKLSKEQVSLVYKYVVNF
jgi:cytochrome c2